jgi:hypothetical protein
MEMTMNTTTKQDTPGTHPTFEMASYPRCEIHSGPETGPGAGGPRIVPVTVSFEVAHLVVGGSQPRSPSVAELAAILRAAAVTVEGPNAGRAVEAR